MHVDQMAWPTHCPDLRCPSRKHSDGSARAMMLPVGANWNAVPAPGGQQGTESIAIFFRGVCFPEDPEGGGCWFCAQARSKMGTETPCQVCGCELTRPTPPELQPMKLGANSSAAG
eukprot:14764118-Alexandrium_andersonii.AAC.1